MTEKKFGPELNQPTTTEQKPNDLSDSTGDDGAKKVEVAKKKKISIEDALNLFKRGSIWPLDFFARYDLETDDYDKLLKDERFIETAKKEIEFKFKQDLLWDPTVADEIRKLMSLCNLPDDYLVNQQTLSFANNAIFLEFEKYKNINRVEILLEMFSKLGFSIELKDVMQKDGGVVLDGNLKLLLSVNDLKGFKNLCAKASVPFEVMRKYVVNKALSLLGTGRRHEANEILEKYFKSHLTFTEFIEKAKNLGILDEEGMNMILEGRQKTMDDHDRTEKARGLRYRVSKFIDQLFHPDKYY